MSAPLVSAQMIEGFAFGFRTPCVRASLDLAGIDAAAGPVARDRLDALLARMPTGNERELPDMPDGEGADAATWIAALVDLSLAKFGMPFVDRSRLLRQSSSRAQLLVPCFLRGGNATLALIQYVLQWFGGVPMTREDAESRLRTIHDNIRATLRSSSNSAHLARAAFDLDIAFQELPGSLTQFGIGRRSIRMDSTFTPDTPRNGVSSARRKDVCSLLLKRARLPVPEFGIPTTPQQATQIAERLGYPVVVKPVALDGGEAVEADLRDARSVETAYRAAERAGPPVMVEKHIERRDYRLTVFRDEMIWAVERRPAGVTGDGRSTVADLIERTNAEPGRGEDNHSRLKTIKLDEGARQLLREQDLAVDDVPEAGRFVRLARKSNVSAGGTPVAVTDSVHPDNAELAVRAARELSLDLAGVDLILPDIGVSWRESGGGICEINACPEIGGTTSLHLYPEILGKLVPGDGHVPVIAMMGAGDADRLAGECAAMLTEREIIVGLHHRGGLSIGATPRADVPVGLLEGGRCLTGDRSVAAIVLGAVGGEVVVTGLPVPRIDTLVLTGEAPLDGDGTPLGYGQIVALLATLLPHCRSTLILDDGDADEELLRALRAVGAEPRSVPRKGIIDAVETLAIRLRNEV